MCGVNARSSAKLDAFSLFVAIEKRQIAWLEL